MTTSDKQRRPDRANNGRPTTIAGILQAVNQVRPCSRQHLYTYLDALGVAPVGVRTRPQRYPGDTARRVIERIEASSQIVSLAQLRAERRKRRAK